MLIVEQLETLQIKYFVVRRYVSQLARNTSLTLPASPLSLLP